MKKIMLIAVVCVLVGCSGDQQWFSFDHTGTMFSGTPIKVTLEKSEFKGGQLSISGQCRPDGEILLILPLADDDDRIIGAPKCLNGRYTLQTSTFGRPPCEVLVEFGGYGRLQARVQGTERYCR